jgi:mono/diheme cytochrome c family protein
MNDLEETMRRKGTAWKVLMVALVGFLGASQFAKPARSQAAGEALYKTKCATCHGPDGKGETAIGKANKLRDLASPDVQKQSDDELSGIISAGKSKMPAYGKSLKPEQIKDLVTYIRTFKK